MEIVYRDFVDGKPDNEHIRTIAREVDLVIGGHEEGAKIRWAANPYNKLYGIIGVTIDSVKGNFKDIVDGA